ncbi:hypothetical protein [Rhizobium leguminosarum]|uniref:hypothetical protein n=1 Tax=Rhizobium leguminosarum TaxID=384 RepID=UPI001F472DBF|nr:hypothetical protein [Rhizobium leguminosarum]UIJ83387.1 hypothetical protein LZK78_33655 [Rhizobium leguminosarum]
MLSGKDGYRIRRPPWFIGTHIMAANRRDREFALLEGALLVGAAMRDFGVATGIFAGQDLSGSDIA